MVKRKTRGTIHEIDNLEEFVKMGDSLGNCLVQGLDLSGLDVDWNSVKVDNSYFMGCLFRSVEDELLLRSKGAFVFPRFEGLPYNPYRSSLYSWRELMEGYSKDLDNSLDLRIYTHFKEMGRSNPDVCEALAQRIHDHAIDNALRELLQFDDSGMTEKKLVGIMGGHGAMRGGKDYVQVARTAQLLAREGYMVVSGGGPGVMEAANLGAYMSPASDDDLERAIGILAQSPSYKDGGYIERAEEVIGSYPFGGRSLAIPTWFYGHEPSNLFASSIAKYFSNSLREDCLLAVCLHGIVYARGSAGTTQEIFQDATQNHYGTFDYYSPMVFLGRERYEAETSLYPMLRGLAKGREYEKLLFLSDDPAEVVDFIKSHPPVYKSDAV